MKVEIEAKFLNINVEEIRKKLKDMGAKLKYPERLMKRKNFDYPDWRLEKEGGWVRVRDEGNRITLSYKQLSERTLHGTKEASIVVNDFDDTCAILQAIGLVNYSYQETKRESWDFNGTEIEIDNWPWVPTFLEIEGKGENEVRELAEKLGLDWNKALFGSVEIVYQAYYNVTEEEVDSWEEMRLGSVPEWLEKLTINN